jgi:uncharacterized membrane protein YbhN (UPF0104 family)
VSAPENTPENAAVPAAPPPRKRQAMVLVAAKVMVTLGLLAWLGRSIAQREGFSELTAHAEDLALAPMLVAVLLHFAAVTAGVLRWRVLLGARGISLPLSTLFRSFLVGRFLGAFTPSTTGLDGYRLWDVARRTGQLASSTAVIAIEKLVGLVGMATVCVALLPFGLGDRLGITAVAMAMAMAGVALAGIFVLASPARARALAKPFPKAIAGRIEKLADALTGGGLSFSSLAAALALGIASHLALSATFAASGVAFGVPASVPTLLSVGNAIVIAVLLPVSIGGVGVREGVAVALLAGAGVDTSEAVLLALGSWLTGQVPALLGGLVLLLPSNAPAEKKTAALPMRAADSAA